MKKTPRADMVEATRLTRQGRLAEATALIQRLLHRVTPPSKPTRTSPSERRVSEAQAAAGIATLEVLPAPAAATAVSRRGSAAGVFADHVYAGAEGSRNYKLYVPSGYDGTPAPLIVMLHGCTQSVDDFAGGTNMNAVADERGCFVAYPIQSASANQSKCWNWFQPRNQQRDGGEPAMVVGIVRQIAREYAVDRRRVYAAGLSAGGAAAAVLGARYPDVFAAIGVHSGIACGAAHDMASAFARMHRGPAVNGHVPVDAQSAAWQRAVPTIVFHGDKDPIVHPANGDHVVVTAANASRLTATVETSRVPGGREYTRQTYRDDAGRLLVEQWTVHGARHAWSGGNAAYSYTDAAGPDASRAMMTFFLSHRQA